MKLSKYLTSESIIKNQQGKTWSNFNKALNRISYLNFPQDAFCNYCKEYSELLKNVDNSELIQIKFTSNAILSKLLTICKEQNKVDNFVLMSAISIRYSGLLQMVEIKQFFKENNIMLPIINNADKYVLC